MVRYDDTNGNDVEAPSGSVHCSAEAGNVFFVSRSVRLTALRAEKSTEQALDGENA